MKIQDNIIEEIKKAKTVIIHRHVLPDGDAIGSQLALKQLIALNFPSKAVYAVGSEVKYLQFLGTMDIIDDKRYEHALVIITDTANTARIDDQRYQLASTIIKIDHHPNHDQYGNYQWVDTSYPATCQMIADLIFNNNLKSNQDIAKCLLTGIITDTTRFMLRQISARTFDITSKLLVAYQANITTIYDLLDRKTINEVKLLNYYYENYQVSKQGIIYLKITNKYLKQIGINPDTAAFHVNVFNNIINHPIWVIAIEYDDLKIRCELRTSNPIFKVNTIALQFNGGGHNSAAGCKLSKWSDFDQVIKALETLLS